MSSAELSDLLRVRKLQTGRARRSLAQAVADRHAAWAEVTATDARTAEAAQTRAGVLSDMGRQTGSLREIYQFAKLTEDHAIMLDREAEDRRQAAAAADRSDQVVQEITGWVRTVQRAQEKTSELLTVMRGREARTARRMMTRREEDNAGSGSI